MTEPKYRAWDHANECMYYSDNYQNLRDFFAWVEHLREGENTITLMQYTGLSDRHETDVYRKDIAEEPDGRRYTVEWNDTEARFELKSIEHIYETHYIRHFKDIKIMKIIGNTFEDPMPLKVDTV